MKKLLVCALALGGFAASAQAADLSVDSMKDPLPDTISYAGVTIYGTIDVGYGYNSHGLAESGALNTGLDWGLQKLGNGSISSLTNNALEQSKVGLKIEEGIGGGFVAIGKLQTEFNPASGEIADACQSVLRASNYDAKNLNVAAFADGSRCGQAFQLAYAGVSNPMYGTLTAGRQNSSITDSLATYDPLAGSFAFSLIGFSGGALAGIGSTETARWDNSVKYIYQYGPVHAAVMYTGGGQDTPMFGDGVGANIGGAYQGVSIDGYYTKENGAVAISPSGTATGLSGTVTNNEALAVMGKYTYDFGGGFKDEGPASKLTFFAGYVHMDLSNPDHTQNYYNGFNTEGGYVITMSATGPFNLLGSDKTLETEWVGATYQMGPWSFTGAYYHEAQNSYLMIQQKTNTSTGGNLTGGNTYNCAQASGAGNVNLGVGFPSKVTAAANCAGDINWGSFVVDYTFSKHFDVYAGVTVEELSGGLASAYLQTENVSVATGLRLKF